MSSRQIYRGLGAALLLIPCLTMASPASESLRELRTETLASRDITLKDLGITAPIVLADGNAHQDFYLPVPAGVVLSNANIQFAGRYLKGEPEPATLVLSLDGQPTWAQRITDGEGRLEKTFALSGGVHRNGFVRLSVDWQAMTHFNRCSPNNSIANSFTVSNDTVISYRYNSDAITTLKEAWSTLPGRPVLLVADEKLEPKSFDSAWRLGIALERNGKRVDIRALPSVGSEIDLKGVSVPSGLTRFPAFSALSGKERHKLANPAELGALLVLNAPAIKAELAIVDEALHKKLNAALDALQQQLSLDAAALEEFSLWRKHRATAAGSVLQSGQISLLTFGKQKIIGIADNAGAQASGVFSSTWRNLLVSEQVDAKLARADNEAKSNSVRLTSLDATSNNFDVVARGDWTANFPLSVVALDGRMPETLVLDVAAAPSASTTKPVVSVFWNGILLSAKQLNANGRPERLTARVPGYVLGVTNSVKVSFQRQPVSANCDEIPQGYPVEVLPSSHIKLGDPYPDGTFIGLLPLLSNTPQLFVPEKYLASAPTHLKQIVRIGSASGLSPTGTRFVVASGESSVKSKGPFLSMEVPVSGAKPKVQIVGGKELRVDGRKAPLLDIKGVEQLSTVEVIDDGKDSGLYWYALLNENARSDVPFVLNRGNIAVIGDAGPLAWIDSANPDASHPPGAGESAFFEWRRYISWSVPAISIGLLALLLLAILARRASRKRKESQG
ncbi:membrane protein [Oxalicibacterium flavum]|uniref:Membrane protein n=2 Tax=Oxalicibacterium flavum TaxID=179467 RepID=A0A8J2XUX0_9BURK|nr:membrane protein [Oxalicibacterium flavum]